MDRSERRELAQKLMKNAKRALAAAVQKAATSDPDEFLIAVDASVEDEDGNEDITPMILVVAYGDGPAGAVMEFLEDLTEGGDDEDEEDDGDDDSDYGDEDDGDDDSEADEDEPSQPGDGEE